MSIGAGDRLGVYEVIAYLGAGGMGEVYRARDTKLGRDVAIKILPDALSKDHDRLARFEREAKLLATLSHPRIAVVYGLDEHEGTQFLAMELVEGQTLERKIEASPLPTEEALRLAVQIAEALDAAHEKGVIHRDLKPANIMVTDDGRVKVLDFGLAKTFGADPSETSAHALSTAMTQHGLVLGTAAYMSPEQARGWRVDKRADIWAFGCVVYEMLTGRPPFGAEDSPSILARVLERGPDIDSLPPSVPTAVRRTIELCLQKDVDKRMRDIGDVRLALEGAFDVAVAPTATSPRTLRRHLAATTGALVLGAGVAGLTAWVRWPASAPRPVNRFEYAIPQHETLRNVGRPIIALAPDGRSFVYNTKEGLYLRSMDALEAELIRGTEEDLTDPFFSPDGRYVGYYIDGQLKRIATIGGASVVIADGVSNPFGASWAADGSILFGQPAGIFRVPASGGTPKLVIPAERGRLLYGPQLLPDGDSVLFSATTTTWDAAQVVVQSLASKRRTVLVEGGSDARYVPTGRLVYALGNRLFATAFDAKALSVSGDPVAVVQGVLRAPGNVTAAANYDVASDGTLVYAAAGGTGLRYDTPVWVDSRGHEEPLGVEPCFCAGPLLSPDGKRLAFTSGTLDGDADIYIWSIADGTRTRLTFESGLQAVPLWSPDGQRIAYMSPQGMFTRRADGADDPKLLVAGNDLAPWSWTTDGRILVQQSGAGSKDVGIVSAAGDGKVEPLLSEPFDEARPTLSPDERWLAYESNETGHGEIYVRPFPNVTGGRWQVSAGGGEDPKWARDGRTLYFFSASSLVALPVEAESDFRWGTPRNVLDRRRYVTPQTVRQYDISTDGQRFLMLKDAGPASGATGAKFVVVQNLFAKEPR